MKKSLHSLILTLALFCIAVSTFAQSTVTIGPTTGTNSYFYGPYYRSSAASTYNFSNYGYLYTASELNIPPGAQIIEVAWLKASGTITGNNVFNLWMENNTSTTLGSTTWGNLISTATPVYTSTTQSFTAANNTYERFPLSSPFVYSGGSLTIIAEHEKTGVASAANNFYYETATGMAIGYASSTTKANASTTIGATSYSNRRPTIQITYQLPVSNDAGVAEVTAPINFCPGVMGVKVKIKNYGNNIINSVKVGWSLDGIIQSALNVNTPLDTVGGNGSNDLEVTLGTYSFTSLPVNLVTWTYLPNGVTDGSTSNDTLSKTLHASLKGNYTINSAQPTGGTNFNNFTDFTAELSTSGVCDKVIVDVINGPYIETVKFGNVVGASATNTIRINGNGAIVQFANTSTDLQLLTLNGTQYLTIDNLNFQSLATAFGWAALITNGSTYDSIINCTFDMSSITTFSSTNNNGMIFSASATSATTAGANGSHCYIANNHIKGPDGTGSLYYGISLYGACDSNIFENNIIENTYYYGLRLSDGTGNKFYNNEIHNSNKTATFSGTFYGIYSSGTSPGLEINATRIHHPGGLSGATGSFNGIYTLANGTPTEPILVANNLIYGANYDGFLRGIYLSNSKNNLIYHNTIVFDQIGISTSANYGIYSAGTITGTEFKNNNISITGGTTGSKYGFYYGTAGTVDVAQKNNFYVNSSQSGDQYYGYYAANYPTKDSFQTAFPSLEVGSPAADPMFIDSLTADFHVQNPLLIGVGENLLAWVSKDINGDPRPGAPTIGAFEQPPSGGDNAGTAAFITPSGPFCAGPQAVSVSIYNAGVNNITNLQIHWSVDGVAQPVVNYTGTLVPLTATSGQNSDTVTLGNVTFQTAIPLAIKVWTSMPNGIADTANLNDTIQASYQTALSGIYTINAAQVTGGTNYQSFTDFSSALTTYGICGDVVANVSNGSFNEFVKFGAIAGSSENNTIRINGNGAIVQFANTTTDRQLLTLNGTQYLTIDNLYFQSLATDYGWAALITNGANHDSITNCSFDMSSMNTFSSVNNNGIVFSGSATSATTAGANGSHCYIANNHIKGSDGTGALYYGISLTGACDSNLFENNIIENSYYYGLRISDGTGNKFVNNEIHNSNKTAAISTTYYAIYTSGTTPGLEINGNRVHHPDAINTTGTFYGIYATGDGMTTDPVLIANNAIYNINKNGTIYGIYLTTAPYNFVFYNTVVIDQLLTGSSAIYGLYASGTNTDVAVKNNNIAITGGTTGTKYGFYYSTATSISDAQKNNIYVNSTQTGTQNYGYFASVYSNKAAFQTANPTLEVGSPDVDPMFVNPMTGNLNVLNPQLFSLGEDLSAWISEDINGQPRSTTPTIGAFERTPTGNNAGVSSIVDPSGTFCPGQESVSVSIYNAGINDINSVEVNWSVDGVAQPMVNYTGTLVPLSASSGQNSDTVVLGNVTFQPGIPLIIKVWTSMPNGLADTANLNDTIQASYQNSLNGIFTINAAQPTGGSNYQSFTDFSNALNSLGVCGPVTVNVSNGPFLETVSFGDISGMSDSNPIRINGNGEFVQSTNTSTDRQMLTLNGTKYLTIDNLNFQSLATGYGWGALITNGAAHDSIINCSFDLTSVTSISSVDNNGIIFSGSKTSATVLGPTGSHCYIGNNHVFGASGTGGPYYGIVLGGDCDSNMIVNNLIENFYFTGIRINARNGNKVLKNEFHKENKTASFTTFYGIYTFGTNPGLEINSNRIHHPGGTVGSTGTFYGIYAFGDGTSAEPILIANNLIYGVNYDGQLRGIYLSASEYNLIYHNTIVFDQIVPGGTSASGNYGIYTAGINTGTEFKNNNVSITGGTVGPKYGFYYTTAAPSIGDAQKNNFYLNSTQAGTQSYGYYSLDYPSKASFQTAYPNLEVGSPDTDPMFVNPAAGDFNVTSPQLIGTGENLTALVPGDINGSLRPTTPTIGAYEEAPILPVRMDALKGRLNDHNLAILSWNTFLEVNNAGFEIQHSLDGKNFNSVGFVSSLAEKGNSHEQLTYSFTDDKAITGTEFYRLKQIDFDGHFAYSNIVMLSPGKLSGMLSLIAYPNPTGHTLTIEIFGERGVQSQITIVDILGKVVRQFMVTAPNLNIDFSDLPSGVYMINYKDEYNSSIIKVTKK